MANDKVTKALGEKFTFSISNTSGAVKVIALLAAFFDTLAITLTEGTPNTAVLAWNSPAKIVSAGYTCDAVLDDGTIAPNVVCTSMNPKKSIRQFKDYIRENPRVCVDITIQATLPDQFNQTVEVIKYTPLIGALNQELSLNDFKSVDQYSTDKINLNNVQVEMSFDTLLLMPVPTGCTTTVTFKFS